jgi:hypothetical protein
MWKPIFTTSGSSERGTSMNCEYPLHGLQMQRFEVGRKSGPKFLFPFHPFCHKRIDWLLGGRFSHHTTKAEEEKKKARSGRLAGRWQLSSPVIWENNILEM